MSNGRLSSEFNVHSIPALSNEDKGLVRNAELVVIFDKGTPSDVVCQALVDAHKKTGIQKYMLVSRDTDDNGESKYKKTFVSTPYWSGDSMAEAAKVHKDPLAEWYGEFMQEIFSKWRELHKPAERNVSFKVVFAVNEDTTDEDLYMKASLAAAKGVVDGMTEWKKTVAELEAQRSFDGSGDQSLSHKAISLSVYGTLVQAFAYINSWNNRKASQAEVVQAANLLNIPAAKDFNASPIIALPGDDATACSDRTLRVEAALKR